MKKLLKNEIGITLVALVVTIIILLILAGISISSLTNSGLFEKAREAEQKSQNSQIEEEGILADYENKIGEYVSSDRSTTSANSENTMSGTEHFTGEYYLDGKPIYEKTVKIPFPNTTGNFSANHNIQNIDKIWFDSDICFFEVSSLGNQTTLPLPYTNTTSASGGLWYVDSIKIGLYTATNRYKDNGVATITVNYTKTTDNATKDINVETLPLN